jgi:hypothetical protein
MCGMAKDKKRNFIVINTVDLSIYGRKYQKGV